MSKRAPEPLEQATDSLRKLDHALRQQPPSEACDERVLATFRDAKRQPRPQPSPWLMRWAVAFALLLVLSAGSVAVFRSFRPRHRPAPLTMAGGFVLLQGKVRLLKARYPSHLDALQCITPQCQLHHPARRTSIELQQDGRIAHAGGQLHMLGGIGTFDVAHRRAGESSLQVRVSHGVVEVLGTRFTIHQQAASGQLKLIRGRVRFVFSEGQYQMLLPGQMVHWPRPMEPPVSLRSKPPRRAPDRRGLPRLRAAPRHLRKRRTSIPGFRSRTRRRARARATAHGKSRVTRRLPEPQQVLLQPAPRALVRTPAKVPVVVKPVPRRLLPPKLMLSNWIQRLDVLRAQGQYAKAAQLLRRDLRRLAEPAHLQAYRSARERLYYELGILLTYNLSQPKQACRHWQQHMSHFPRSRRYQKEIRDIRQLLKCP